MITLGSFLANLALIPAVVGGAAADVLLLKRIPQRGFAVFAKVVALAGAIRLLLP